MKQHQHLERLQISANLAKRKLYHFQLELSLHTINVSVLTQAKGGRRILSLAFIYLFILHQDYYLLGVMCQVCCLLTLRRSW